MLAVSGTVPVKELPLIAGRPKLQNGFLILEDARIPCTMGTAAMVSTTIVTCDYLGIEGPYWITAGDLGEGSGSRAVYKYLVEKLSEISPNVLSLHYILPILTLMREVMKSTEKCDKKPILIADAGSMYAVKAIGFASRFDILTPDAGELAFLADPDATHPAYIQRYLFGIDTTEIPKLVRQAYTYGNAPKVLLVKNPVDHIAKEGQIIATIDEPNIPELESIGGTGDTITGLVSAFLSAGYEPAPAAIIAAKANRMAGKLATPSTATKVFEIISQFSSVFKKYLRGWAEVHCAQTKTSGS